MTNLDDGHVRVTAWICATILLILGVYSAQVSILSSGLNDLLLSTFGTVFPAFPFLVLLLLLTALRWNDFHRVLLSERGLLSKPKIRLAGVALILAPFLFWWVAFGSADPEIYLGMELSAASFVLVAYGTLIAINPSMLRIMLPYAALYSVGLIAPLVMLDVFAEPLIGISSYLTASIVGILGIPVTWQGAAFQLIASNGDQIGAIISAPCSAAYSISIYLALLGLMYLDMRKSISLTTKLAVVGVFALPLLNSARIAITIWFGYQNGTAAFWGIHDWIGYAMFLGFYLTVLVTYSRSPRGDRPVPSVGVISAKGLP